MKAAPEVGNLTEVQGPHILIVPMHLSLYRGIGA